MLERPNGHVEMGIMLLHRHVYVHHVVIYSRVRKVYIFVRLG